MARMAVMGSVALVVSPIIFGFSFRKSAGLEALSTPEKIVWFYAVGRGGHITDIMIGTEAGKLFKMPVASLKEGPEAMALLRKAAPAATEGHSEQRRVQFVKEPAALRASALKAG